jgi:hypothetical protein
MIEKLGRWKLARVPLSNPRYLHTSSKEKSPYQKSNYINKYS